MKIMLLITRDEPSDSDPREYAIISEDKKFAVRGKFDFGITDLAATLGEGVEIHNIQLISKNRFEFFASVCREV